MKKATLLSILILWLTLMSLGCGAGSGSGSAPGAAPSGDQGEPPAPPQPVEANSAPVAEAGMDQTVPRGTAVSLEGSGSSDPDGDLLSFQWTILSRPAGSTAALSRADQPGPTFTPDLEGSYLIQLIVVDAKGLAGSPDTVTVSTSNSTPVADAGPDQFLTSPGTTVTLDGKGSWDPDGDGVTYSWVMKAKPEGSLAVLSDPASPTPSFVGDVYGAYVIELTVRDASAGSAPDTVTVSFGNLKPVADAGISLAAARGSVVRLDGSGSYDPNGDPITYQWSFVYRPAGSAAELMAPATAHPFFTADLAGTYVVSLVVSDGVEKSGPGSATVTVFSAPGGPIQDLLDALEALNGLPAGAFKNRNMKKTLANKINTVIENIDGGFDRMALDQLENDILKKMDGCGKKSSPEHNDWIVTCEAQGEVVPHIAGAIAGLKAL